MKSVAGIICTLVLVIIAVQDFRSRRIAWWLLPPLLVGLLIFSITQTSIHEILNHTAFNILFILLQLGLLMLYFSIRQRRFTHLVDTYIGLGDILLLVCLSVGFSPMNFIVMLLSGLLLSLVAALIVRIARPQSTLLIPLAGFLAVPLIVLVGTSYWLSLNLHNDNWLLNVVQPIY
jgi:hypothetical protein